MDILQCISVFGFMSKELFVKIESVVDRAVEHIIAKGCDDIFKPPIFIAAPESDVIRNQTGEFRAEARQRAIKFLKVADVKVDSIERPHFSLVAKDEFTYRRVAWMDPFASVKFLSLALFLFEKIETARIPSSEKIIHSHRYSSDPEILFNPDFGYDSFRKASSEKSKENIGNWKVITDISNFFDRIGNHSLENQLHNLGCEEKYRILVRELLFSWTADRRSFGLPVGSDASRILAEAALVEVDRELRKNQIDFIRYVDDYRIFATSRPLATKAIAILTNALAQEGLHLNSKKTKIIRINDGDQMIDAPTDQITAEHEPITTDVRTTVAVRHNPSGTSSISKFYKPPANEKIAELRACSQDDLISEYINSSENIEIKQRNLVKFFIYSDEHDVEILRILLEHRITSIIYIVDALQKEAERLTSDKCDEIAALIYGLWNWSDCANPLQLSILRLATVPQFKNPVLIEEIINRQESLDNMVMLREALLLGGTNLPRNAVIKLVDDVEPSVPIFVKRAIYLAVKNHSVMLDDEKRSKLKNLRNGNTDWFMKHL